MLSHAALSGSGIAVKGLHLVDPRTGRPPGRTSRTWAMAPSAAISDALSTAFFVMTDEEIAAFCRVNEGVGAAILTPAGAMEAFGTLSSLVRG
jgi:thiamine biosynthesis lipoprotein